MAAQSMILVAEDDANDFFFLQRAFKKANLPHSLVRVADGEQALQYLHGQDAFADRQKYPLPNLMVLDLKMPRMNGFELLAQLQSEAKPRPFPIVVLSGSDLEADRKNVERLGADGFRTKPQLFDDLLTLAKELHIDWLAEGTTRQYPKASKSG